MEKVRLGEVGGNTLGFYGGFFDATGSQVIAHSYHGAFHIWRRNNNDLWESVVTPGGHFGEVIDLAWEPQGEFLYSVSTDQTTRIHAPWQRNDNHVRKSQCITLFLKFKYDDLTQLILVQSATCGSFVELPLTGFFPKNRVFFFCTFDTHLTVFLAFLDLS